ncbi:MAG: hypothetical protein WC842_01050 [Candidatus Paceibacterota bacterium]|jgi:hypothetical protein
MERQRHSLEKNHKNKSEDREANLSPEACVNLSDDILRGEEKKLETKLRIIKGLQKMNLTVMTCIGLVILGKVFGGENEARQLLPFIGSTVALGTFNNVFQHLGPKITEKLNRVHEKMKGSKIEPKK